MVTSSEHATLCPPRSPPRLTKVGKQSAKEFLGCLLSLCSRSLTSVMLHMKDWRQMLQTAAGRAGQSG